MKTLHLSLPLSVATTALLVLAACTGTNTSVGAASAAVTATCVDSPAQVPAGALRCGDTRVVECTGPAGTDPGAIYATPVPLVDGGVSPACADTTLVTDHVLPLPLGTTTVAVSESAEGGTAQVCTATITVRDTTPPVATSKDSSLWPPNHAMTRVGIADCVTATDTCSANVLVSFTYASSDEAPDSTGDGHTTPDVNALACDAVELRAERKGNADGRTYRLGWKAVDPSGNATTGECKVTVPHDQGGKGAAVPGPEAYRVAFPPCK
jgi:hypothetical protein